MLKINQFFALNIIGRLACGCCNCKKYPHPFIKKHIDAIHSYRYLGVRSTKCVLPAYR